MPCFNFILTTEDYWLCLVTHGGVASIDSSDYKAPTNILMLAPAKITLHFNGL